MSTPKPKSGEWTPLDTVFIGGAITPVRPGQIYPWDHPLVQAAPELFASAELPPDELARARAKHRFASMEAESAAQADTGIPPGIRVFVPKL
jgi:hypothetical protein